MSSEEQKREKELWGCLLWGGLEGVEEVFVPLDFSVQLLQVTFRDMCIPAVLMNIGDPDDLLTGQKYHPLKLTFVISYFFVKFS